MVAKVDVVHVGYMSRTRIWKPGSSRSRLVSFQKKVKIGYRMTPGSQSQELVELGHWHGSLAHKYGSGLVISLKC